MFQVAPSSHLYFGLGYRTTSDDERADLMRRFGHIIQGDPDAYRQHPELAAKRLSPSDDILKFNGTAAEYLAEIRSDLPKYRAEAGKYAELFANVDNLADYDTFAPRDWPNNEEDLGKVKLPPLGIIFRSHAVAALDWAQDRENEAWRRVCRNIKTGRSLLHSRPSLIYPMIGNAIILRNTDLAAQMLYEKPDWANRLPAECSGMFDVLAEQEQSLCLAMQDEFHLTANLSRKMEGKGWQMMQVQEWRELLALGGEQSDAVADFALLALPRFDAKHSLAIAAPHYAAFCKSTAAAVLRADRKAQWPQLPAKTFARKWACLSNSVGCRYVDQAMPLFDAYVLRLQDTAMQQRAFQAALALYRLPVDNRRAALDGILAEQSSPSRKLSWNEQGRMIYFEAYSPNKAPDPIPLSLDAGR